MRQYLLLLLLLLSAIPSSAQTLTGKAADENGKPMATVSVTLVGGGDNKVVAFAKTNKEGVFSIKVPVDKHPEKLSFRLIGYAPVEILLDEYVNGQTVVMVEQVFKLKELKVTPQRIKQRNDTIVFSVDGFKQQQDRSIADVIKKMPGMDVKDNGQITYQGKAINEFTVEGMDLTNGKYAQISENLSADKVKSVEIRENNQPKKVLRDVQFSEQAALNLVLKDDAKNVWQGLADVKIGSTAQDSMRFLYDTRLMGMMFAKKKQSVSMWKTNNTGKYIKHEVAELIFENGALSPMNSSLSTSGGGEGLNIEARRYMFNDSQLAATNWLFKTKGGDDVRGQATFFFDKTKTQNYSETIYNDILDGFSVVENASLRNYVSQWEGELQYKSNKENMFMNNRLKGNLTFSRDDGMTDYNHSITREHVKINSGFVTDAMEVIRKMKNGQTYSFVNAIAYDKLPGKILLCDSSTQHLDMAALRWNTAISFRHNVWKLKVTWSAGSNLVINEMDVDNILAKQKVKYNEQRLFVSPGISYEKKQFRLNTNVKMSWLRQEYEKDSHNELLVEPTVFASWSPNSHYGYGMNYMMTVSPSSIQQLCNVPVFNTYRTARVGEGAFNMSDMHYFSIFADYKNILKGLFINTNLGYNARKDIMLYESSVDGNIYRSFATGKTDNMEGWSANMDIAKSFSWAKAMVKGGISHSIQNYHMLIGERLTPCRMSNTDAYVGFSLKPLPFLSVEEKSVFTSSKQTNKGMPETSGKRLDYFKHKIKLFLFPGKWQVEMDNEVYHSNESTVKFCHFLDFAVSYRTKRYEVELWMNNVIGSDQYEIRYNTNTQYIFSVAKLRPREAMVRALFNF